VSKFIYQYEWIDWQKAANDKQATRTNIRNKVQIGVYPDTLCWIRDFSYSYNEPFSRNYFWHPAYDDYPVVGVNWKQANAFCHWRTKIWNQFKGAEEPNTEIFRLPSEVEWEYAARGGRDIAPYPWGGPYVRNAKGCLLANFKPGRGNYPEDGGMHTVKADAYFPNDYGLYTMSGNVAEWTSSAFHENAYAIEHDLNPDYRYDAQDTDPEAYKRKVIRGGSWKDISYYLQTGTRNWEFQDTSKSYIGFRCVLTYLGRSINDF
jgi:gliding motility-associated lipoprotein GldK